MRKGVGMIGRAGNKAADLLVFFDITGDLGQKTTWRALYRLQCRKLLDCPSSA